MRCGIEILARAALVSVVLVTVALATQACRLARAPREPVSTSADRVAEVHGTVHRFPIESETWVITVDDTTGTRYLPDDLPVPFRQDGLHVVFSGRVLPIPPGVRLVGTPLALTAIRSLDGRRPS